jgi:hypothetical protein
MEVLVELSTSPPPVHTAEATAAAAAGAAGSDDAGVAVKWTPRAVAHFVMVLAKSQQQQQQQVEGPAWGVPVVVPETKLQQQHFDTGEADRGTEGLRD